MSRHALITGVSSGIGAAIADKLLEEGWRVTGLSRTLVKRDSDAFVSLSVDLFDTAALKRALVSLPPVDAVIHAAGMMKAAPLGDLDEETSEKLWQLHIRVAEVLANQLAPQLPTGGRIVLIGSRTSTGAAGRSQYVSTKSAMKGMVRSWAAELAPRGITANIVAPGATATPMLSQPGRESSPPKMPPIGRYIQPEEVAALVGYLLSPAADAITGQELVICGGGSL
ncbi:SDR family NAD(P)-dependent oxidoreductase [Erwinia sp. PsM31]|uniref:SDR family NAD(P)-dependent oxidoreductase n=1 Tax=Erwinia sp. PsM31 TaxID=3030535 RepID=UPI00263ACF5E|nr:SDR family oxidoreductase [Erwinia sp. PsM31]MDN4626694.1 SDR family NAD(P)-dependent oxidoreductase [Erwinia sp. PsM31]